jgi:D-alanyl-D-alanine carboxypeptidase (penicillin-binding protein 5/6)
MINTYAFAIEDNLILSGESALLIDYDTGGVLYEKNPNGKLFPASTTKIMTGILAIEKGHMKDMITIDPEVIDLTYGSHIALDYDEEVSFEDLLNAMLIASANDAALALGKHISGSIEDFVKLMNDKAKEIGAINTNFVNPNGLHDDNHVTTAHDLALIAKYAMENEVFRSIVGKSSYTIGPTNKKDETRYLYSTNKFLYGSEKINLDGQIVPIKYDGVLGIKTGYTDEARNCLVTFAEKNGQRLISVVLKSNGKEVYADTHKLLNYGFNNFDNLIIGHANEFIDNISIENGEVPYVSTVLDKDIIYPLNANNIKKIEKKIILNEKIEAPISKGDILGNVEYYLNNDLIGKGNIISTLKVESIPHMKFYQKILDKWYLVVFTLLIIFRALYLLDKSKKRRKRRKNRVLGYSPNIK